MLDFMNPAGDDERIREFIMQNYREIPSLFDYKGTEEIKSVQERVDSYLSLKETGLHFNERLISNREFRNPNIYVKLLEFADLNEYATNIEKTSYDPTRFLPHTSYKHLGEMQREEHNRRLSSSSHK
ncbi:hypothetical protein MDAP_002689 [Mitosporidium daphniae]